MCGCAGCRRVKNFVVSSGDKSARTTTSRAGTRACHVGDDIVCDEKRTHACCRALPLRRATVLDAIAIVSRCVQLGTAYVVTTWLRKTRDTSNTSRARARGGVLVRGVRDETRTDDPRRGERRDPRRNVGRMSRISRWTGWIGDR